MQTAAFYRAKGVELAAIAAGTISAPDKAHWVSMAQTWNDLASRTEAEDSFILKFGTP